MPAQLKPVLVQQRPFWIGCEAIACVHAKVCDCTSVQYYEYAWAPPLFVKLTIQGKQFYGLV